MEILDVDTEEEQTTEIHILQVFFFIEKTSANYTQTAVDELCK